MSSRLLDETNASLNGCARIPSLGEAKKHNLSLVASAQRCYDEWDEMDEDTYAGGGICHLIADGFVEVLQNAGIEAQSVCSHFEQHVYVICRLAEGVYSLDIPFSLYEIGAAYSWQKIPGVVFDTSFLDWDRIDSNSNRYAHYVD